MPRTRFATVSGVTGCVAAMALILTACDESQQPIQGADAAAIAPSGAPVAAAPHAAGAAEPTLGRSTAPSEKGYGQVRPSEIDNGGDPTGIVMNVHWTSWGEAQATGEGTGYYEPDDAPVAESRTEPAHIVAYELGTCQGKLMYQRIAWYFPGQGESFDPKESRNICTGD